MFMTDPHALARPAPGLDRAGRRCRRQGDERHATASRSLADDRQAGRRRRSTRTRRRRSAAADQPRDQRPGAEPGQRRRERRRRSASSSPAAPRRSPAPPRSRGSPPASIQTASMPIKPAPDRNTPLTLEVTVDAGARRADHHQQPLHLQVTFQVAGGRRGRRNSAPDGSCASRSSGRPAPSRRMPCARRRRAPRSSARPRPTRLRRDPRGGRGRGRPRAGPVRELDRGLGALDPRHARLRGRPGRRSPASTTTRSAHSLIARTRAARWSEIEVVLSHPQASAQCARFIREKLPGRRGPQRASSTAEAVREVSRVREPWAALGAALGRRASTAAWCCARGSRTSADNVTRFVWIAPEGTEPDGRGPVADHPGLLRARRRPPGRPGRGADASSPAATST